MLHGVGDTRSSMVGRARFLHRAGYTVLLPDFQAHGESEGARITFGALESLDAEAALAFLRTCSGGERVGMLGVSMGGAAALLGPGPLHADAYVLESVYPTIRQALEYRLGVWLGPLGTLNRVVAPLVIRGVSAEIGIGEDALRPIDHIGRGGAPIFVIAGTRDAYTPLGESRALFEQARERRSSGRWRAHVTRIFTRSPATSTSSGSASSSRTISARRPRCAPLSSLARYPGT